MPNHVIQTIQTAGITVSDADQISRFYGEVLDFHVSSDLTVNDSAYDYLTGVFNTKIRILTLKLGEATIRLIEYLTPSGRPIPADSQASDRWFQHLAIVVSDMDRAYEQVAPHLESSISAVPQTMRPPGAPEPDPADGVRAFKFQDPDGHNLELIHYPPGQGGDRWRLPTDQSTNQLFLGIDHSAITVADTDASLGFYRDLLGFQVSGVSTNAIAAQEQLDGLFSAKAQITRLDTAPPHTSPHTWGIELLEYRTPPGGRPFPIDHRSNDLMQVQLELVVEDLPALFDRLENAGVQLVSPKVITLPESDGLLHQAALVRDPDGHSLLLVQCGESRPL